jgi:hypothetical protein
MGPALYPCEKGASTFLSHHSGMAQDTLCNVGVSRFCLSQFPPYTLSTMTPFLLFFRAVGGRPGEEKKRLDG